jgi:hypothetical protein
MGLNAEALALQIISVLGLPDHFKNTNSLEWPDPGRFHDLESRDTSASNGEVLVWGGDCVDHLG